MGRKIVEILSADIRKLKSTKSASLLKKIVHDLDRKASLEDQGSTAAF
jgi:hypothetical protein